MVSKKKRPPPAIEASDPVPKKSKPSEAAGTSSGISAVSTPKTPKRGGGPAAKNKAKADEVQETKSVATDGVSTKGSKRGGGSAPKSKVKNDDDAPPEQEEEDVPENNECRIDDFPDWTPNDLLELMKRMERAIPATDILTFASRLQKLDWDVISFGCHSPQECKETWLKVQARVRKFRLLKELIEDGKAWAAEPWTHFYRSRKQNRHPDMPRRPLSTYMLFYLATKDKVAKEHPGLEMTEISKYIADMYKALPEKKKKKYSDMAAVQRKEYDEKMIQFYQEHPTLIPKQEKHDARSALGPKRPLPPFKLFLEDKLKRHKNDPEFDKTSFVEKCKEQWKSMPDKKKVIWINWACEEEAKYTEELKAYMSQNPEFVPGSVKNVLTKEEKTLRERVAGKPEKPPNSGYSLFSRLMLASEHMKDFSPKQRMIEISRMWKNLQETQKKKYQERVNHMLDQYKLEYATYLESLPEDKRQEELQSNLPKARKTTVKPKVAETIEEKKNARTKNSKHPKNETPGLYKGEPEPLPRNEYFLFVKALLQDKNRTYSEKEAPKLWQMLPDSDKAKYRKKLSEIKTKYIQDYEKFLNSLSPEELKEYSAKKKNAKKEHADVSDDSGKEDDSSSSDDSDDDDDDDEEDQESGSDDSSSDSESGSSDSSESNDGDSKNSGDSSSSVSDSD